jgi:SAM-dependent methyltransferase
MPPAPNFDKLARPYRWLEYLTFGRLLEQCRFHFLPQLQSHQQALVLGDGDGRFLCRLLQQNPALHATAVDISPAMLHLLTARCNTARCKATDKQQLTTFQSDIRRFTPETNTRYDLIVTHFFLDCLTEEEIAALATRLRPHLQPGPHPQPCADPQPGTEWIISEFALPSNPLLRPPARLLIRLLYTAFALLTGLTTRRLPNYQRILESNHWQCLEQKKFAAGLLTAQRWKFIPPKL